MKKLFIILAVITTFTGCRSKQKVVAREHSTTVINEIESLKLKISETFKSDSIANYSTTILNTFEGIDIDLIQADSSKTITITTPDGKTTTIKGANVKLVKQKSTSQTKDTTSIALKKEAEKTTIFESQSNKILENETRKRATATEIKSTSTWLWVSLIVIALGFIAAWRLKLF